MDEIQDSFFQLKADFVPLTVVKITRPDQKGIQQQLLATINKAPNYFRQAPILIDVSEIENQASFDFPALWTMLKEQQLIPVAIRGLNKTANSSVQDGGIAILKATVEKENKANTENNPIKNKSPSKIITKPIRSGSQVYAKGGDLIILAGVNPGGECFADGSIHVYGPLRGRAFAGVCGDQNARIFCKSLAAELIAIAGCYQVNENIKQPTVEGSMTQIYLHDQQLHINTI